MHSQSSLLLCLVLSCQRKAPGWGSPVLAPASTSQCVAEIGDPFACRGAADFELVNRRKLTGGLVARRHLATARLEMARAIGNVVLLEIVRREGYHGGGV